MSSDKKKLEGNYTRIPNKAVRAADLTSSEFRVLAVLCMYRGAQRIFPSYNYIAECTGLARGTISEALKGLGKKGIITYKQGSGERKQANEYTILPEEQWKLKAGSGSELVQDSEKGGSNTVPKLVQESNAINKRNKTNNSVQYFSKDSSQESDASASVPCDEHEIKVSFISGEPDEDTYRYGSFSNVLKTSFESLPVDLLGKVWSPAVYREVSPGCRPAEENSFESTDLLVFLEEPHFRLGQFENVLDQMACHIFRGDYVGVNRHNKLSVGRDKLLFLFKVAKRLIHWDELLGYADELGSNFWAVEPGTEVRPLCRLSELVKTYSGAPLTREMLKNLSAGRGKL